MTGTQCDSTFFGVQCQESAGHPGDHYVWHTSGYITTWDDSAADSSA